MVDVRINAASLVVIDLIIIVLSDGAQNCLLNAQVLYTRARDQGGSNLGM